MDTNEFSKLSLANMLVEYERQMEKGGPSFVVHSETFAEYIYEKFFDILNRKVCDKYPFITRMGLSTSCSFKCHRTLKSRRTSYYLLYDADEEGESDYEPLVRFVIYLDKEKLNEEYINYLFGKISEKLDSLLQETFEKWAKAMSEYYTYIHDHYSDCLGNWHYDSPAGDPDKYFLTHEIVVLN